MPAPADVDNYRDILTGIAEHATGAVVTLMQQYDTTPTPELRDVLLEGYPQIIDSYVAAAQDVSAEFYTQLKPDSDFVAESGDLPDAGDLAKTVNWAFNQDDPEAALAGSTGRMMFKAARDTVQANAVREGVLWARDAQDDACPWCAMMAAEGAVYGSEDSATGGHDNCECVAVPVRDGDTYDPPERVDKWVKQREKARKEVGDNFNDIVNYVRAHNRAAELAGPDIVLDGVHYTPEQMETNALALFDKAFNPANNDERDVLARIYGPDWYPQTREDLDEWRQAGPVVHDAYEAALENGGITIDLGGNQPIEGYAYAPAKNTELVIPEKEFTTDDIDKFIDAHFDELNQPGNHLGLWTQDGNVYLDVSRVGQPTPATIAEAQKAEQLAVFDLKNFGEITIGEITNGKYEVAGEASNLHSQYQGQVQGTAESRSAPSTPEVSAGDTKVLNHTQAAGIMSVLSGNTSYTNNVVMTRRYFDGADTAAKIGTSEDIFAKVQAIAALDNPTREQVAEIVKGKDAPKQLAFFYQLDGDDSAAVIDVHQTKVMLGLPIGDKEAGKLANRARSQTGAYEKMAKSLTSAAEARGISVGTLQATDWIEFRGTPF